MGRPNRKRPRPPPLAEAESSALQHTPRAPTVLEGAYSYGNHLRSLVNINCSTVDEATLTVQHVWGAVSEGDIPTASSAPSSGRAKIEIDRAGDVCWLVNTPARSEQGQRRGERSSTGAALDSQGRVTSPSPPRQPMSDGHASAAAEGTAGVALRSEHDHAERSPPSGSPFCACEAPLREQLSRAKEEFDDVPVAVFKRVRSACNPAEALGSGSFLNRSAMKLANIDAILGGLLAQVYLPGRRSRDNAGEETGKPEHEKGATGQPPLQFVDLCGGPGGFSEYLLRRRRQLGLPSRGWGISLREDEGDRIDGAGAEGSTGDGGATSQDAAMMDENDLDVSGGDCSRSSLVLGGQRDGTRSLGTAVAEDGKAAHRGERRDHEHDGRNTERDPCAWRLDHLRPWCEVSESTAGAETTPTAAELFGNSGNATKHAAAGDAADTVDDDGTAAAAAAAVRPLSEMRIDYGPKGTGDLTDEANLRGFVDTVLASTAGRRRPDLVVADGGFGAARDALAQESLVSRLVHCEALAALLLLGEGGVFVCKLFECWTQSTAALVYLLHRKFRRIAIVKPITSRPASGERYLVCTGLLPTPPSPAVCRFTNALRAKVLALQETRVQRRDRGASPLPAAVSSDPGVGQASCPLSQEGRRGREVHDDGLRIGNRRVCLGDDDDDDAAAAAASSAADDRHDAALALGVEVEMKRDESFMSYLRLSNNVLASLQAKACARIVDVASTKRGRAWAFRDSNSSRRGVGGGGWGSGRKNAVAAAVRGELLCNGDCTKEGSDDDAKAVRCFSQAWGLDGI